MEQSFVMVKPDGVERGLIGEIISRIEAKGLRLVALKIMKIEKDLAREHYIEHADKPFYGELVGFITSAPVVAMVWSGPGAVKAIRTVMGTTDPLTATPGTIRGDFGIRVSHNLVHGSDSPEAASREIGLFFSPDELVNYERQIDSWI
ncbi:MAG: nucleoside-diphosphate kinase [Chitinophagales bacterium]